MKKSQLYVIIALAAIMVTSCKCDDEPVPEALLPYQNVLESTLISNVVSIGAALNSVYLDLIPDSLGRANYADAMLRNTRFFSDNQGYFYVESLSGYCIIDAAVPSIEGVYHPDVAYIQEMIEVVKYRGYGWVNYDFTNPLSQILEKKSGWVRTLPSAQWYIGSGYYASELIGKPGMTETARQDFEYQTVVHTMAQGMSGVAATYAADTGFVFNAYRQMVHHNIFNSDGSGYFFVYNLQGVVIAHGATPTLEGQNLIDYQDAKGNFAIQMLIDKVITEGSGFVDYYWLDPADQQIESKRAYVEKIEGTDMFVGSGFYHVVQ